VYPIVQDWHRFPEWGRNINYTVGESGLAGHWIKLVLHYLFLYKAKGSFLWWMIPE
jgi:sulfide:quinone oxidoreductase